MDQDTNNLITNAFINSEAEFSPTPNSIYTNIGSHDATERNRIQEQPRKFNQFFAAITATMSAFSSGMVLGWTSPILDYLSAGHYGGIQINDSQLGWIGSFVTLGAMIICIPSGMIIDRIGRKKTLLLIVLPFVFGWILIIFARNILVLYLGRFITGMAVGVSCIAGPVYTSEIAHKSVRGTLGSFFQLMIVSGILMAYLCGELLSVTQFTVFCAVTPVLYFILFAFQPETPVFLIRRGLDSQAKEVLLRLRGRNYDVDSELNEITNSVKDLQTTISVRATLHQKSVRRAILISFALMFFQQFSGINAILFYTSDIFKASGATLNPNLAAIIVGVFQVISTLGASIIIDKVGRRFLLVLSTSSIAINTLVLAIYFSLKYRGYIDEVTLRDISFVPVGALSLFVVAFSIGLGPIPWLISSEIFPVNLKSIISSSSASFNWFLAFLMTKFYLEVSNDIGEDSTFYIFSIVSVVGFIFVLFCVPETKGKTTNEILNELECS